MMTGSRVEAASSMYLTRWARASEYVVWVFTASVLPCLRRYSSLFYGRQGLWSLRYAAARELPGALVGQAKTSGVSGA